MRKTNLYEEHVRLGARIVDFAGWKMPVQYTGIIDEHLAVRKTAGLFDVSHMGEVRIKGAGAFDFINMVQSNDLNKLTPGKALYSVMLTENGGIIDDLLVYQIAEGEYFLCVNASNAEKDVKWLKSKLSGDVELVDESDETSLIALQGPKAFEILDAVSDHGSSGIDRFHVVNLKLFGIDCMVARTGYTGEDGFEIFIPGDGAVKVWRGLLEAGAGFGLKPAGLGARDTLRLEMGYTLHGSDIDETTNPLEAGLKWICALDKTDFIGKNALLRVLDEGLKRKLVGVKLTDKGIPRHGMKILSASDESVIGEITSGTMAPSLNEPVGIGYIAIEHSEPGTEILLEIRKRKVPAVVVKTPFYRRKKSA